MYRLKHGFECHTGYNGTVAASALGPRQCHYTPYGTASNAIWPYGIVVSGYSPNVNCHLLIGLQLKQLAPLCRQAINRLKHGFSRHKGYNGTVVASALGPQARGRKPQRCHYSPYGTRTHALTYTCEKESLIFYKLLLQ